MRWTPPATWAPSSCEIGGVAGVDWRKEESAMKAPTIGVDVAKSVFEVADLSLRVLENPSSFRTKLAIVAQTGDLVDGRIFDPGGRVVCSLYHGEWQGRERVLEWDGHGGGGRNCGSGVYFVRVHTSRGQKRTASIVRLP
jgi:hypothetical protein